MSAMKQSTVSDCFYPESTGPDIVEEITSEFTKLRGLLGEVALAQKVLDSLLMKQKEDAEEAVRKAQQHLVLVTDEQASMRDILRQESTAANEIFANNMNNTCAGLDSKLGKLKDKRRAKGETERLASRGFDINASIKDTRKFLEDQRYRDQVERERLEQETRDETPAGLEQCIADEEQERIALAEEEARLQAEQDAYEEGRRIYEEEAAEKERQREEAMIAAIEERRAAETENARQAQEEADMCAKAEEERLAKFEEERLAALEAALIVAVEERRKAQAEQKRLEEERLAKGISHSAIDLSSPCNKPGMHLTSEERDQLVKWISNPRQTAVCKAKAPLFLRTLAGNAKSR